jgi:hypothetical protein
MHGRKQFWEKETGVGDNHKKEGKEKNDKVLSFSLFILVF